MVSRTLIPDDEREDFEHAVAEHRLDPLSFEITVTEVVPVRPGPIQRTVKVRRGNRTACYDGSSGKDWLREALNDVACGRFE